MNKLFSAHILNQEGIEKAKKIANYFDALLLTLEGIVGADNLNTREFSILKTKLEEASFYAKKAMTTQPQNQEE